MKRNRALLILNTKFKDKKFILSNKTTYFSNWIKIYLRILNNLPLSDPINWSNIARIWSRAVILVNYFVRQIQQSKIWKKFKCHQRLCSRWRLINHYTMCLCLSSVYDTCLHFYCFKTPWLCFFVETYGGGLTNDN